MVVASNKMSAEHMKEKVNTDRGGREERLDVFV
jgi:hypothetical protein